MQIPPASVDDMTLADLYNALTALSKMNKPKETTGEEYDDIMQAVEALNDPSFKVQ